MLEQQNYIDIYKNGTYYNPAHKHYPKQDRSQTNVVCDRCQKTNLGSSIGWQDYDLCLECTSKVEKLAGSHLQRVTPKEDPGRLTYMMQGQFSTRMLQSQFRDSQAMTKMEQSLYTDLIEERGQPTTNMEQGMFRGQRRAGSSVSSSGQSTFDTQGNFMNYRVNRGNSGSSNKPRGR